MHLLPTQHVLADAFQLADASRSNVAVGYEPSSDPLIPTCDRHHHFDRDVLRRVINFLNHPDGDALYLTGPTGSGKTSGIAQILARLYWPMQSITAHGRMEFQDLVGHHSLVARLPGEEPTMTFVDGPLTNAMKQGHVLLINEVDLMDPSELSGLNDVLEGRPLVIAENGGEVVRPHEMFRVVVTGNSAGGGDETGAYLGVRQQNIAAMDRYRVVTVNYLPAEVEEELLKSKVPDLNKFMVPKMVEMANNLRQLFTGDGESGSGGELSFPMSTRVLIRWARQTLAYEACPNRLQYALEESFLARAAPEERIAIERVATNIFGKDAWQGGAK